MEERTQQLEERVMYLEKMLAELDAVVTDLNTQVAALRRQWRDVRTGATVIDPNRTPEDDIPPHYGPPRE